VLCQGARRGTDPCKILASACLRCKDITPFCQTLRKKPPWGLCMSIPGQDSHITDQAAAEPDAKQTEQSTRALHSVKSSG
jgi:hypothetical protein